MSFCGTWQRSCPPPLKPGFTLHPEENLNGQCSDCLLVKVKGGSTTVSGRIVFYCGEGPRHRPPQVTHPLAQIQGFKFFFGGTIGFTGTTSPKYYDRPSVPVEAEGTCEFFKNGKRGGGFVALDSFRDDIWHVFWNAFVSWVIGEKMWQITIRSLHIFGNKGHFLYFQAS